MSERLIQSVPSGELESYYECGWAYLMPDFDNPGHSKVEWLSNKMPVYPSRVPATSQTEDAHGDDRGQQPA